MHGAAADFIERMGVVLADDGLPRIAGRIFGLLLLTPHERSLDEIAERLGVSKGSVSMDARRLEQRALIERVSRPGDRRDYYRVRPDVLANLMELRIRRWRAVRDAISDARGGLRDCGPEVDVRLAGFAGGIDHVIGTLTAALASWPATAPTRATAPATADCT